VERIHLLGRAHPIHELFSLDKSGRWNKLTGLFLWRLKGIVGDKYPDNRTDGWECKIGRMTLLAFEGTILLGRIE
jgi:hypothetical protein